MGRDRLRLGLLFGGGWGEKKLIGREKNRVCVFCCEAFPGSFEFGFWAKNGGRGWKSGEKFVIFGIDLRFWA